MHTPPPGDDLDRPLGFDRPHPQHERGRDVPYGRLAMLGVAALGLSLGAFVYLTSDPNDARPSHVASIAPPQPAAPAASPPADTAQVKAPAAPQAPPNDVADPTTGSVRKFTVDGKELEDRGGVKVARSPEGGSGPLIIQVPESLSVHLAPAPDKRVSEKSGRGVLPKVASDGTRPADLYARKVVLPKGLPANAPRIAVVVGGLGLDEEVTLQAVDKLPPEVTLAFTPDGIGLPKQAAKARDEGHEIMLEAPMAPPEEAGRRARRHGLGAAAAPSQNIERLHWMMSRFAGYVGVMGYRGDDFTANAGAMRPVLRELGERGLIYAEDGTAPHSLAKRLAPEANVPFAATDVVLDADQGDNLDAALARLEEVARNRGSAVGSAAGQPSTIEQIERWSRGLEARGIALVPFSAAAAKTATASSAGNPER